jgi:hypothetical protein
MHETTIRIPAEITFSTDPAELDDREDEKPATKESLLAYLKDAMRLDVDTEDEGQPEGAVFAAAGVDWDAAEVADESEEGGSDEDNTESNVPCVVCGRSDLPLHSNGRCGTCGPGSTTDGKVTAGHEIRLPCYGITIRLDRDPVSGDPGCGTLTSDLKATGAGARSFNKAIDGLEALILAHACAGIDVASTAYVEGIESAVDAIDNHYGP